MAVGADALASAALAPLQGQLVDRFGRAKVLAPAALAQAMVLIALALAGAGGAPAGVLIPLSGLAGAVMPPIVPSVRALLLTKFPNQDTSWPRALPSASPEGSGPSGVILCNDEDV